MENTNQILDEITESAGDVLEEVIEEVCEEMDEAETKKEIFLRKCDQVKACCAKTAERVLDDLKECDYNPYFKQTRTYRLEVYTDCTEDRLVDVFETTDVKRFSARSLLIAGGVAVLLGVATNVIVKKILD